MKAELAVISVRHVRIGRFDVIRLGGSTYHRPSSWGLVYANVACGRELQLETRIIDRWLAAMILPSCKMCWA